MKSTVNDQGSEQNAFLKFLQSSEMGCLISTFEWSKTILGPIENWPQSLKTSVDIILHSSHPMWMGWGHELIFLYNDAYISVLGLAKHPQALGKPAAEVWAEIWDVCGPLADKVIKEADSIYVDNVRLFMKREDYVEEVYYSFSYSPIHDNNGLVKGLFCPSTPTTEKMLSERRLKTLGELSTKALVEKTIESTCVSAMETLAKNRDDIPFALLYLINSQKQQALLTQVVGLEKNLPLVSPIILNLEEPNHTPSIWPITDLLKLPQEKIVSISEVDALPLGVAEQRVSEALFLPLVLPNQNDPIGILIAGVNPGRKLSLDKEYRTFYNVLTQQIVSAIQNAKSYEDEKHRIEMLAEIDKAKTLFFSNVSHEFRTPLTLMLSPVEDILLNTNEPLSSLQREKIELVQRNGQRLLKLVNSLLDFSRIEAKRMQIVFEPTDLTELTRGLAGMFHSTLQKAGLKLNIDINSLGEEVYVDREMWEKIIFNLLSNAFKFTLEGSIQVSLRKQDNQAVLTVTDTGVGIPANELPKIFERFHRVEGTQGRSFEGTGIGLALIHELVQLHHGTIQAESQEGRGSCFMVSIPLGHAHLPIEHLTKRREAYRPGQLGKAYVDEAARWLPESQLALQNAISSTNTLPVSVACPAARILVVDDNIDMRRYISSILAPYWQIEIVENGEAALQAVSTQAPDLVLSDAMMPKLDGFSLLKILRENPQTQTIPIILLSARAGEEAKIEGLKAGADDYLVKPFAAKELVARVESCLKITQYRKAAFQREQELLMAAQNAEIKLQQIVNNLKDGFVILDYEWKYVYANEQALIFLDKTREQILGKVYWDLYPDVAETELGKALQTVMQNKQATIIETFYLPHNRWYENRIYPHSEGLCIFSSDITLRKQLETERQQAMELANKEQLQRIKEAEDYRRKQTEFIDTLCHELRNPLNGVFGSITLLKEEIDTLVALLPENVSCANINSLRENIEAIEYCSQTQKSIVDDVLDLSRLDANKVDLNPLPFDFKQNLNHITQIFSANLKQKKLKLDVQLPDELWLKADQYRLSQICTNLISNAIKFTHAGIISIQVGLIPLSNQIAKLIFIVKDTGIGMTDDELQRLFQRFHQANRRTASAYGGSGLGLLISKKLVEMMNGKIEVTSQKGVGTCFTVEIQIELLTEEEKYQYKKAKQKEFLLPLLTQIQNKTILIVEDNPINQKIIVNYLKTQGCICKIAQNGQEALEQFKTLSIDLIFMDIEMPVINGLEATRHIRAIELAENRTRVPIVGLSGNVRKEQVEQALEAGMDDYLTKPYQKEDLIKMVNKYNDQSLSTQSVENIVMQETVSENSNQSIELLNKINQFQKDAKSLLQEYYPFVINQQQHVWQICLNMEQAKVTPYVASLIIKELKEHLSNNIKDWLSGPMTISQDHLYFTASSHDNYSLLVKQFMDVIDLQQIKNQPADKIAVLMQQAPISYNDTDALFSSRKRKASNPLSKGTQQISGLQIAPLSPKQQSF